MAEYGMSAAAHLQVAFSLVVAEKITCVVPAGNT
jgi:hypothetical protein